MGETTYQQPINYYKVVLLNESSSKNHWMSILLKRPGQRFVLRGKVWGLKTSQAMAEFLFGS